MTRNLRDGGALQRSLKAIVRAQLYIGLGYSAKRVAEITGVDVVLCRHLKERGAWRATPERKDDAA